MSGHESSERPESDDGDHIHEEAALWVARLRSADASQADREAFEAWRAADPAHAEAFAEMEAWRRRMDQAAVSHQTRRRPPKGTGPAVLAALALSGVVAQQLGIVDRYQADLWTGVGTIRTDRLSDGSRVDLNTDTALALHFTPSERGVSLLRGEAVFEVVPDPTRPFVVHGSGLNARAIGTRFVVRADGTDDLVGVTQGRVQITTSAGQATASAGEAVHLNLAGQPVIEQRDVERSTAWREGKLVFSGEPLSAVLRILGRYRHGRILLLDAALGARRFSGTLNPRDTDESLAVLMKTMGARVTRVTPLLVLVTAAR